MNVTCFHVLSEFELRAENLDFSKTFDLALMNEDVPENQTNMDAPCHSKYAAQGNLDEECYIDSARGMCNPRMTNI